MPAMPRAPHAAVRLLLAAALVSAAVALGLDYASQRLFGTIGVVVHVRWAPEIGAARSEALEARFGLTGREPLDGDTSFYLLVDPSTSNIRALVTHPDVRDTQDLDRSAFAVADGAERVFVGSRLGERRSMTAAAAAGVLGYGAALLAGLALLVFAAPGQVQQALTATSRETRRAAEPAHPRVCGDRHEGARGRLSAGACLYAASVLGRLSVLPTARGRMRCGDRAAPHRDP